MHPVPDPVLPPQPTAGERAARRTRASLRLGLALALVVTGASIAMMVRVPAAQAADDYPYAGMGQCPLEPLPDSYLQARREHRAAVERQPGLVAAYEQALREHRAAVTAAQQQQQQQGQGQSGQGQPGPGPLAQVGPAPTPPPPVPPAPVRPERECAKNVWYVNGSMGDPWGFALRHCTSFVSWRLRETGGFADFSNYLDGGHFSNAENWDDNARALGYLVDDVPAVGAVAQTDDGVYGHVAWVSEVGEGTVTIEEYNHVAPGVYSTRTVPESDFRYLHLADVSPAAGHGSDRPVDTVVAADGRTVEARTTDRGDLVVRTLDDPARPRRLGAPGGFATQSAPTLAVDAEGDLQVAAVARDGRLLVGRLPDRDERPWRPDVLGRGFAATAGPALADVAGRLTVVATTSEGRLVSRHRVRGDRWSRAGRLSTDGPVSVHTDPALATDASGRSWLATVATNGTLETRHTQDGSWSAAEAVGRREWSITSTPALTPRPDGQVWMHSVTATGGLEARVGGEDGWSDAEVREGTWSPYSSPAVTQDSAGRTWLAAVTYGGRLVVADTPPASGEWRRPTALGRVDLRASPALITSLRGAVGLAETDRRLRLSPDAVDLWVGGSLRGNG